MKSLVSVLLGLCLLWGSSPAKGQGTCSPGATCVSDPDLKVFVQLARDQKCRFETLPKIELGAITVIVDRQGRVYYSGNQPQPYKLRIDWCNYQIDAEAAVRLEVAKRVEPTWGFRLRLKASAGFLAAEAFDAGSVYEVLDAGLLLEPFFVRWANVNLFVGVRSYGLGVGCDLTSNVGLYLGYSMTWGVWASTPYLGVSFSLW